MYTREIQNPRPSPVENGRPLQGTWTEAFKETDLLSIRHPFSVPLPRWIRDTRLKEWESFIIQDDHFYLAAMLCNLKYYRIAQVIMHDKDTRERLRFRKIIPGSAWSMPRSFDNASIDSRSLGFFFRIHNWLDADIITLDLNIKAAGKRPSFAAHAEYDMSREKTGPMAVSMLFSERRSMCVYKVLAEVRGDMVFGGRHISLEPERTSGTFLDYKGFFPYRMRSVWCNAFGFDAENRRFGFSLGENQTREGFQNNENALWVDGSLTPLPPVKITQPGGVFSDWIIQDMEGMVDLVFSPQEQIRCNLNLLLSRGDYDTPLGFFNGVVLDSRGERIEVRNLWGLGEKLYLRV
jgi:hypothetical protein